MNLKRYLNVIQNPNEIKSLAKQMVDWVLEHDEKYWLSQGPKKNIIWKKGFRKHHYYRKNKILCNVFYWKFPEKNLTIEFCFREECDLDILDDDIMSFGDCFANYNKKNKLTKAHIRIEVYTINLPLNNRIKRDVYAQLLGTLAHELQHYRQFILLSGEKENVPKHEDNYVLNKYKNPGVRHWKRTILDYLSLSEIDAQITSHYMTSRNKRSLRQELERKHKISIEYDIAKRLNKKAAKQMGRIILKEYYRYAKLKFRSEF